jgi:hypothetical protein
MALADKYNRYANLGEFAAILERDGRHPIDVMFDWYGIDNDRHRALIIQSYFDHGGTIYGKVTEVPRAHGFIMGDSVVSLNFPSPHGDDPEPLPTDC